uniref:Uncharacterized protein n=1 Tax=Candidatus Kentrum sp. LFY TaxID=2126342 RepID=A0A450WRM9_9GAMM|nr:MAG: hypothetical protein BECKLFY1418C_GA0070996_10611 [Candidatus Kentron sp. LFY]
MEQDIPNGPSEIENTLRGVNARIIMYQELLDRAYASYDEFLKQNEKVGRITRLLQAIDES